MDQEQRDEMMDRRLEEVDADVGAHGSILEACIDIYKFKLVS
jgi:hypothetical protein